MTVKHVSSGQPAGQVHPSQSGEPGGGVAGGVNVAETASGTDLALLEAPIRTLSEAIASLDRALINAPLNSFPAWVERHHELLQQFLRLGVNDPWLVLPTLLGAKRLSGREGFGGDGVRWVADNYGMALKDAQALVKAATWFYRPSAFALSPEEVGLSPARQAAIAGTKQRQLRQYLAQYRVSLMGLKTLHHSVQFLCEQARHLAGPVMMECVNRVGEFPSVHALQRESMRLVKEINRNYVAPKPPLETQVLRFSSIDPQGMQVITARCTAQNASLIRKTLDRIVREPGFEHKNLSQPAGRFQALLSVFTQQDIGSEAAAGPNPTASPSPTVGGGTPEGKRTILDVTAYDVGVVLSVEQFEKLEANPDLKVKTGAGGLVKWADIRSTKTAPLDWVAIVGKNGIEVRANPEDNPRFATADQRRLLALTNPYCAYPGCEVPSGACQAHHIEAYVNGGKTRVENLAPLCSKHHPLNDDSHAVPGRFHVELDANQVAYIQPHPRTEGGRPPAPRYNELNLTNSPILRIRRRQ